MTFDSNADGHITSTDDQWGDLRIWVDSNGDAVSQSGELHTLDSLGITDIDLNYDIAGNQIKQESAFTINGNARTIVDAWFQYDNINSSFDGEYTLDPLNDNYARRMGASATLLAA